eukprot:TRINITY_DN20474_c0_g1_i1.p1 TRINITY_DN20474_c0_g1~~TRINITY_DN20474_c0_g1_i1.p1  ORF type:complete len:352 (+),score=74.86 TRINITY_DN20474_c0_g1_i1:3-1058(+)
MIQLAHQLIPKKKVVEGQEVLQKVRTTHQLAHPMKKKQRLAASQQPVDLAAIKQLPASGGGGPRCSEDSCEDRRQRQDSATSESTCGASVSTGAASSASSADWSSSGGEPGAGEPGSDGARTPPRSPRDGLRTTLRGGSSFRPRSVTPRGRIAWLRREAAGAERSSSGPGPEGVINFPPVVAPRSGLAVEVRSELPRLGSMLRADALRDQRSRCRTVEEHRVFTPHVGESSAGHAELCIVTATDVTHNLVNEHCGTSSFAIFPYVYVSPKRRGEGIGVAMMAVACRYALDWGVSRVVILVQEENTRARGFYARLGFEETGKVVSAGGKASLLIQLNPDRLEQLPDASASAS